MFEWYSLPHLGFILFFAATVLAVILFCERLNAKADKILRRVTASAMLCLEAAYMVVRFVNETLSVMMLPLELCTISLFSVLLLLFDFHHTFFQLIKYWAMFGPILSIFFPSLHTPAFSFRCFHYFIQHTLIFAASTYLYLRERPPLKHRQVFLSMALLLGIVLLVVLPINSFSTANFMFLKERPAQIEALLVWAKPVDWLIWALCIAPLFFMAHLYYRLLSRIKRSERVE